MGVLRMAWFPSKFPTLYRSYQLRHGCFRMDALLFEKNDVDPVPCKVEFEDSHLVIRDTDESSSLEVIPVDSSFRMELYNCLLRISCLRLRARPKEIIIQFHTSQAVLTLFNRVSVAAEPGRCIINPATVLSPTPPDISGVPMDRGMSLPRLHAIMDHPDFERASPTPH